MEAVALLYPALCTDLKTENPSILNCDSQNISALLTNILVLLHKVPNPVLFYASTVRLQHVGGHPHHLLALSAGYKLTGALKSLDPQGPQYLISNARHQLPITSARFENSCSALIKTLV